MDAEFINAYIGKQKVYLDDLFAKNIMLETQLELSQKLAVSLSEKIQELEQQVIKLQSQQNSSKKTLKAAEVI